MAVSKARQYKDNTVKRLFALSGNECAFPNCTQKIVNDNREDFTTQICHIEAAEPGGQRYNAGQTDDDRRSFENLLLLCPNHHVETNDTNVYTVDILRGMKKEHEAKMLQKVSTEGILNKYPTSLVTVINQISSSDLLSNNQDSTVDNKSFGIERKIEYNNVKRYRPILEEYKVYQGRLNKIYEEIEVGGSFKKEQLLLNIKSLYLKAKGYRTNGKNDIEIIKENADLIIEDIEKNLWELIEKSNNLNQTIPLEVIQISMLFIIVDAFMRCKILEEPQ